MVETTLRATAPQPLECEIPNVDVVPKCGLSELLSIIFSGNEEQHDAFFVQTYLTKVDSEYGKANTEIKPLYIIGQDCSTSLHEPRQNIRARSLVTNNIESNTSYTTGARAPSIILSIPPQPNYFIGGFFSRGTKMSSYGSSILVRVNCSNKERQYSFSQVAPELGMHITVLKTCVGNLGPDFP